MADRRVMWVGAAALAAGLSVVGPQAQGVAAADSTGADSASVSAGTAAANSSTAPSAKRGAAGRAARLAVAAGTVPSAFLRPAAANATTTDSPLAATARRARAARPAAGLETRRRTVAVPAATPAGLSDSVVSLSAPDQLPTTAAAITPPQAGVAFTTSVPSVAKPAAACGSCWAFGANGGGGKPAWVTPPTLRQVATVHLARTIDRIGGWLSGLPNTPFTDFVSGALLMVRRALVPDNPGVGSGTVEPFLKETDRNDGVKGTIKNSTGGVVRVSFNDGEVVRELQPGQEMTYYDGHYNKFWIGTYDIFGNKNTLGGRGPSVRFEPPLGTPNPEPPKILFLLDGEFTGGQTRYTEGAFSYGIFTYRPDWNAGDVHQEVTRYTNIKVTFDGFSWNGGYDNWWNSDWAVFYIEILKNEPYGY